MCAAPPQRRVAAPGENPGIAPGAAAINNCGRDEDVALYVVRLDMIELEMKILECWGNTYSIEGGGK